MLFCCQLLSAVRVPYAQVYVREGQDFNLTCNGEQLGLLFDGCTQKWFKDGRAVKSYGDTPPQEVILYTVQFQD